MAVACKNYTIRMINSISIDTLLELIENDPEDHGQKEIAKMFLEAMENWPAYNQTEIPAFIKQLKEYFGTPLIIEKIAAKKFDGSNAWQWKPAL
jgi:hypothetical protein